TCISMPLSEYEASPGVSVELCAQCRGLFLDRHEIRELAGGGSLAKATEVVPVSLGDEMGMRCPKCVDPVMQPLRVRGADEVGSWQCRSCGGLWLGDGAFFHLARALRTSRQAPRILAPPTASRSPRVSKGARLTHSRSQYDQGMENLIAVPVVMLLSLLFCLTGFGRLLAFLVGMPFHEVGHATASWLSSRIAIPLPFFTFWFDDQSVRRPRLAAVPHLSREELVHVCQRIGSDLGVGRGHLRNSTHADLDVADPLWRTGRAGVRRLHPSGVPLRPPRSLAMGLLAVDHTDPSGALLHAGGHAVAHRLIGRVADAVGVRYRQRKRRRHESPSPAARLERQRASRLLPQRSLSRPHRLGDRLQLRSLPIYPAQDGAAAFFRRLT
ncbi:MAG: zf-TFIIB domain-containing protein, partial [Deltaproteobacteria bacterium]|nr:zf-TFIIB domain-containing protein [Deltaproteobacteria bacterium]